MFTGGRARAANGLARGRGAIALATVLVTGAVLAAGLGTADASTTPIAPTLSARVRYSKVTLTWSEANAAQRTVEVQRLDGTTWTAILSKAVSTRSGHLNDSASTALLVTYHARVIEGGTASPWAQIVVDTTPRFESGTSACPADWADRGIAALNQFRHDNGIDASQRAPVTDEIHLLRLATARASRLAHTGTLSHAGFSQGLYKKWGYPLANLGAIAENAIRSANPSLRLPGGRARHRTARTCCTAPSTPASAARSTVTASPSTCSIWAQRFCRRADRPIRTSTHRRGKCAPSCSATCRVVRVRGVGPAPRERGDDRSHLDCESGQKRRHACVARPELGQGESTCRAARAPGRDGRVRSVETNRGRRALGHYKDTAAPTLIVNYRLQLTIASVPGDWVALRVDTTPAPGAGELPCTAGEEQRVMDLINAERAKVPGRAPLWTNVKLTRASRVRAIAEAHGQGHAGYQRVAKQFGYKGYRHLAENLSTATSPDAAVAGWMSDAGHRENILNSTYEGSAGCVQMPDTAAAPGHYIEAWQFYAVYYGSSGFPTG